MHRWALIYQEAWEGPALLREVQAASVEEARKQFCATKPQKCNNPHMLMDIVHLHHGCPAAHTEWW